MLGSFSVGKTSLIERYVSSIFSEKYHTTVGVKVSKKQMTVDQKNLMLMLWDIAGEDEFATIRSTQLRGMAGYVLVIDGTRMQSFDVAMSIHHLARKQLGNLPMVFALNKADLKDQWVLDQPALDSLQATGYPVLETSAKLDANVGKLFTILGQQLVTQVDKTGVRS